MCGERAVLCVMCGQETLVFAKESCIFHFPTIPPCSTKVDVLETGEVPILFSLSQMKNLGMTIELETKLHVQLLVCILQLSTPQWDIVCWI